MNEQLRANRIAEANDAFRRSGWFYSALGASAREDLDGVIQAVREYREYKDFTAEYDPYGEHDFGAFDWQDERVMWKIDYRDPEAVPKHSAAELACSHEQHSSDGPALGVHPALPSAAGANGSASRQRPADD